MSAPDELRQLADRLDGHADEINETARLHGNRVPTSAMDLRAAAVALRHHANLIDAIGETEWLGWWTGSLADIPDTLKVRLARIATAVPPPPAPTDKPWVSDVVRFSRPAPTTCPTNCASGWVQVQYDSGEWSRELEPCPDSWHQATT